MGPRCVPNSTRSAWIWKAPFPAFVPPASTGVTGAMFAWVSQCHSHHQHLIPLPICPLFYAFAFLQTKITWILCVFTKNNFASMCRHWRVPFVGWWLPGVPTMPEYGKNNIFINWFWMSLQIICLFVPHSRVPTNAFGPRPVGPDMPWTVRRNNALVGLGGFLFLLSLNCPSSFVDF
jgi:hypothetical protein